MRDSELAERQRETFAYATLAAASALELGEHRLTLAHVLAGVIDNDPNIQNIFASFGISPEIIKAQVEQTLTGSPQVDVTNESGETLVTECFGIIQRQLEKLNANKPKMEYLILGLIEDYRTIRKVLTDAGITPADLSNLRNKLIETIELDRQSQVAATQSQSKKESAEIAERRTAFVLQNAQLNRSLASRPQITSGDILISLIQEQGRIAYALHGIHIDSELLYAPIQAAHEQFVSQNGHPGNVSSDAQLILDKAEEIKAGKHIAPEDLIIAITLCPDSLAYKVINGIGKMSITNEKVREAVTRELGLTPPYISLKNIRG